MCCCRHFALEYQVLGDSRIEMGKKDVKTMSHTRNVVISASTKLIVVALIPECSLRLIEEVGSTDGAFYSHRYQYLYAYVCVCEYCMLSVDVSTHVSV